MNIHLRKAPYVLLMVVVAKGSAERRVEAMGIEKTTSKVKLLMLQGKKWVWIGCRSESKRPAVSETKEILSEEVPVEEEVFEVHMTWYRETQQQSIDRSSQDPTEERRVEYDNWVEASGGKPGHYVQHTNITSLFSWELIRLRHRTTSRPLFYPPPPYQHYVPFQLGAYTPPPSYQQQYDTYQRGSASHTSMHNYFLSRP